MLASKSSTGEKRSGGSAVRVSPSRRFLTWARDLQALLALPEADARGSERGASLMMVSNRLVWGVLAVAAGAGLAAVLLPPARERRRRFDRLDQQSARVDEASEDSFPASDPPSFSAPATTAHNPSS